MAHDYLMHYGIFGMKWGVRRFQNPDGTRTEAGKLREKKARNSDKPHYNLSAKTVKKNMDQMNDAELQKALNRLNMQNQVKNLAKKPGLLKIGENAVNRYKNDLDLGMNALRTTSRFRTNLGLSQDAVKNVLTFAGKTALTGLFTTMYKHDVDKLLTNVRYVVFALKNK